MPPGFIKRRNFLKAAKELVRQANRVGNDETAVFDLVFVSKGIEYALSIRRKRFLK